MAFSPWTDLTLSGESLSTLAARDALLPANRVAELRELNGLASAELQTGQMVILPLD